MAFSYSLTTAPAALRDLPWGRRVCYRGTTVFREGDPDSSVYLVESGLIKLFRGADEQRRIILRLARPGDLVGQRIAGTSGVHACTSEALSDTSYWEVSRPLFAAACNNDTDLAAWVTAQVERRLVEVERRMELVAFGRVEHRLVSLLADLAEYTLTPADNGDSATAPVSIPLTQSELAQMVGATRETSSTTLNNLERRGLLRLGRRQIEVVSLQAMRAAAGA